METIYLYETSSCIGPEDHALEIKSSARLEFLLQGRVTYNLQFSSVSLRSCSTVSASLYISVDSMFTVYAMEKVLLLEQARKRSVW
jgi:hypothetical protein